MVVYKAPYDEYEFLFHEVFDVLDLAKRLGHEDLDRDFIRMVMEGWGNYCTEVLLPLNEVGDREGLVFESGEVTMPSGFVDAWKEGVEAVLKYWMRVLYWCPDVLSISRKENALFRGFQ